MKGIVAAVLVLMLSACASTPAYVPQSVPLAGDVACVYMPEQETEDGVKLAGGYTCPTGSPRTQVAGNQCSWVNGYTTKGGIYVAPHTRCRYNIPPTMDAPAPAPAGATSSAPCVTGYCGSVNVRGYTRKDGTYVRPHTRSRR